MTLTELRQETSVPVVIADRRGSVTHVNGAFESVFGWSAQEIIGRPLTLIIPPHLRDAHHLGFSRFLTTGKPTLLQKPLTLRAITKAGQEFDAEHRILAEQERGEWVFGASIRPLSAP